VATASANRIFALIRYMLATAVRDRLFLALLVSLVVMAAMSIFLGGSAITEQQQMATAYMGATSRALLVAGMVLFVAFHVQRAMQDGEIALILSRPISRSTFVLGYGASMMAVATICTVFAGILVAVAAHPSPGGFTQWCLSLLLEVNLMALVAMFFGLMLRSAIVTALGCFGFYVLGRMSGLLGGLAEHAGQGTLVDRFLGKGFELVSIIIPRLDFFARSEWLVYGAGDETITVIHMAGQSLVFIPLILALAIFDFSRKQF